ncbi:jg6059 [Pararge aegeria aegeria]|uniref:Jg6059 protein n=1 Tax=Pararge aegeria aegeria TaxID=348720 RepID=A0A8S4R7F5_9NEOP|nr:jg6059 [Pararge aegeria aegeria]
MVVGLLKCYCNFESCPNSTCETDGYCYAATSLDRGLAKHTYHCWDRKTIFPPGDKPIWCRKEESVDIYCCATDYCNRGRAPGTEAQSRDPTPGTVPQGM